MIHGFLKACTVSPALRVADCAFNTQQTIAAMQRAAADGAQLAVFPELGLTGYTCGDLFFQQPLQRAAAKGLAAVLEASADLDLVALVGLPVTVDGKLYNCAAVVCHGKLLGLVPKTYLPNYGEFYERRQFNPAPAGVRTLHFAGQEVPFGTQLLFRCAEMPEFCLGVEVCEDLWAPLPPSTHHALAGATVIANLSASDETIGKADYRRALVSQQSARLLCTYLYADAGHGESTTDMVFAGENLVYENGSKLAATKLLTCDMAIADVDLDRLVAERRRSTTWTRTDDAPEATAVEFSFEGVLAEEPVLRDACDIDRVFPRAPFVPADHGDLAERCETILGLQTAGLKTRLAHTGTKAAVIGLSGGLDSTLALLVTVRAFDALGLSRTGITAVSMPGFGTTHRTKSNAESLARDLGVSFREVSIHAAVEQHFKDIEHDPAVQDVTYENSQARERTQILMDLANQAGGFVIGTGDLSELALGWATYNGDHMSMYAVNASVPKTLVRHLVRYAADVFGGRIAETLLDILDTPVSPELLPPTGDGEIAQKTEDLVGPYELHDYFLYYLLRFGFEPGKIYRMALKSFEGVYDAKTVHTWLRTSYRRFFAQQFKRSCLPDGPKVGSVTLSPRGDWRMPSDASSRLWLAQIDALNPVD